MDIISARRWRGGCLPPVTSALGGQDRVPPEIMGDVILRDFDGNTLSSQLLNWIRLRRSSNPVTTSIHLGFWQYGFIDWELFYECVRTVIFSEGDWAVFEYDESVPGRRGSLCPPNRELPGPCPGTYILLRPGI